MSMVRILLMSSFAGISLISPLLILRDRSIGYLIEAANLLARSEGLKNRGQICEILLIVCQDHWEKLDFLVENDYQVIH